MCGSPLGFLQEKHVHEEPLPLGLPQSLGKEGGIILSQVELRGAYFTVFRKTPIPSISTSTTSPDFMAEVDPGVPV